jgi:hypothetical protein
LRQRSGEAWQQYRGDAGGAVTADQGNWVSLVRAVEIVHAAIGGAPGAVYQTLIAICAEGLVRAQWTAHFSRTRPAIHKRDWIGADIDWSVPSGRIVKADGAGMAGVDFSEDDLKCWAGARAAAAAAPEHPAPLSKEESVKRAIAGCFPNGIIPGDVLNPSLCKMLGGWLKTYLPNMAKISDSTMLRVAGRKKDLKANRAK